MKSIKRVILAAVAGTVVAIGGGVGIASAQSTPSTPSTGANVQQGDQNAQDTSAAGK
jgi:hypothetical protein